MSLNQAIKIAKGDDEEKVGMSVKMPVSLKEELVALANGNNVSTNALIVALLSVGISGDEVVEGSLSYESLVNELLRLEQFKEDILAHIDDNGGLDDSIPSERELHLRLKSLETTIDVLKGIIS